MEADDRGLEVNADMRGGAAKEESEGGGPGVIDVSKREVDVWTVVTGTGTDNEVTYVVNEGCGAVTGGDGLGMRGAGTERSDKGGRPGTNKELGGRELT